MTDKKKANERCQYCHYPWATYPMLPNNGELSKMSVPRLSDLYIFKYCPMCGRKLRGDEKNDTRTN